MAAMLMGHRHTLGWVCDGCGQLASARSSHIVALAYQFLQLRSSKPAYIATHEQTSRRSDSNHLNPDPRTSAMFEGDERMMEVEPYE